MSEQGTYVPPYRSVRGMYEYGFGHGKRALIVEPPQDLDDEQIMLAWEAYVDGYRDGYKSRASADQLGVEEFNRDRRPDE